MSTYQAHGIILKITDRGEADQLFCIYTRERGKIFALGRATKKIQSKLNGQLQSMALVYLMIAPGKNYDHIASAELLVNFPGIKKSLKKVILGSFALELVEKLTRDDQPEAEIFDLLVRFFQALEAEKVDAKKIEAFRRNFVIKLLAILGLMPPEKVAKNKKALDLFLKEHLDSEIKSQILLDRIHS